MKLAAALEKLKALRDADVIDQEEFEQQRGRLLDACVRRIEASHDRQPQASSRPESTPSETLHGTVQQIRFLPQAPGFLSPEHKEPGAVPVASGEPRETQSPPSNDFVALKEQEPGPSTSRLADDDFRLFESFCPAPGRWSLPPVKVVHGVVQNVRFSLPSDPELYTASVEVDGRQMEIVCASSVCIDAGDRLTLGGYMRDGKLRAVAYHNESKGAHSDLGRLRKGYRFFLAVGRVSWWAGLAAVAGTECLLILRQQAGVLDSGFWAYAPYALSGLAAATVSYVGLGLWFLGARAKEFHDAMNSPGLSPR